MSPAVPYKALWSPRAAAALAFAWGGFFVWSPFYDGVDGGIFESGLRGFALHVANAVLYGLVAYSALRLRGPMAALAPIAFAIPAFTTALLHRAPWMLRLGGPLALHVSSTLIVGPICAAISAVVLGAFVLVAVIDSSEEAADIAVVGVTIWVELYLNASMCDVMDGFLFPTLLPVAVQFAALWRMQARRRWIAEVASGRDAEWQIIDSARVPAADLLRLPKLLSTRGRATGTPRVLVRQAQSGLTYRDHPPPEPVALA